MTRRGLTALVVCAALLVAPAFADDTQAEIQARYDAWSQAMDAKDWVAARAIEAPGYQSISVDGKTESGDHEIAALQQAGLDNQHTKTTVVSVRFTGDTALVEETGDGQFSRTDASGKSHAFKVHAESSDVWTRVGGTWLILSSTTNEFDLSVDGQSVAHQVRPKPAA